jgi:HAD superfamily hydrolase (TIGR01509 family)
LLVNALLHETGRQLSPKEIKRLHERHAGAYGRYLPQVRVLPGARELLAALTEASVPWAIATSGLMGSARPALELLGMAQHSAIVTRDQVAHAKPEPDLFRAAADRLGVPIETSIVIGDSVWDLRAARRALALGVGVLSGGYGREELERAGAYRVHDDPADLLLHIAEVGVRASL